MSTNESSDRDTMGYFLPEDSQFRLKKLGGHMEFLSRLAQPRMWNEAQEWAPEVSVGEIAVCLELLAEQVQLVLEEVSWPAQREVQADAEEEDDATESEPALAENADVSDSPVEPFAFGLSLAQMDALDRLVQTLWAHGDVVAGSHQAEFAPHTLPLTGQAICDGAGTVRALLDEVKDQPLRPRRPPDRVGEARAAYGAGLAFPTAILWSQPGFHYGQNRTLQ